jgi:zinc protease
MSRTLLAPFFLGTVGFFGSVGCWSPKPGPVPVDLASAPVQVVAQPVQGPVTWITIAVRAGSAHDPVGKEGLAALTAQMLREGGAGDRTPEAVDTLLYRLGTDISVVVGKELVTYRVKVLTEDLPLVTSLLADMFVAPALDPDTHARLVDEQADALTKGILQDDEATGLEVLDNLLYAGHPYGHPVSGRGGVVPTLTLQDVRTFLDTHYLRSVVVLGVAGSAVAEDGSWKPDAAAATDLNGLGAALSTLPADIYDAPTPKRVPAVEGRSLLVVEKSTESTGIHFGHPTELNRGHPDWPAMLLAFTALGEHRQSHGRLYRALREDRGLNYGDYAYIERYTQAGWSSRQETGTSRVQNPFYVWIRPVAAPDGPFTLRGATRLVEDFVENGLTEDEFDLTRRYLEGRVALWADDPGRRLGWAVEAAAMGWPDPIATLPDQVAALDRAEVNAAIARHIHPEHLRYVVVTGDAAAFVEAVADNVASPLASPGHTPPEAGTPRSAEDAQWAALPIGWTTTSVVQAEGVFR